MNTHLDALEAEAIYIIREVAAECEKPVMLYSIGKDSSVMLHLAMKAFYPEKPPFPFLHIDTTWKFREMIAFRDRIAKEKGIEMLVYTNEEGVRQGINPFDHGSAYTDIMKTQALKQALSKYSFTAAFGGGRRDEEKSRAKERIFSFRNSEQAWDPKNQRPEMWNLYNTQIHRGESIRVFRSQTGQRRISGSTSRRSRSRLCPCILQRSALSCTGTGTSSWWTTTGCVCSLEKRSSIRASVSVHWAVTR